MIFLALVGLWAIGRGSITITESLRLEGRPARLYGITLIVAAVVLLLLSPVIARTLPDPLLANAAGRIAVQAAIVAVVVIGLVFPFRGREDAR